MSIKEQFLTLATEKNSPCITIAFNTHRTSPDNQQDAIKLKNLAKEAEDRLLEIHSKREIPDILEKLENIAEELEVHKNLESLHIYISKDTFEFIRTDIPITHEGVWIDETFHIRPLIKVMNRVTEYLVLYLTKKGVHLYQAINDSIVQEIENDDFPFTENNYNLSSLFSKTDEQKSKIKDFFNQIDKSVQRVNPEGSLRCLVISTDDNYGEFIAEADTPSIYLGNISTDFNSPTQQNDYMEIAGEFIKNYQHQNRKKSIEEMSEAVSKGQVLTDLQEIYQAAIDGRGDLLIVHQDYQQPVRMKDDRTFEIVSDATEPGVLDDVVSTIAWEVIAKKGNTIFTSQEEIKELGNIVLKTRY